MLINPKLDSAYADLKLELVLLTQIFHLAMRLPLSVSHNFCTVFNCIVIQGCKRAYAVYCILNQTINSFNLFLDP